MLLELTRCAKVHWKEFIVNYSPSLDASHYIPLFLIIISIVTG